MSALYFSSIHVSLIPSAYPDPERKTRRSRLGIWFSFRLFRYRQMTLSSRHCVRCVITRGGSVCCQDAAESVWTANSQCGQQIVSVDSDSSDSGCSGVSVDNNSSDSGCSAMVCSLRISCEPVLPSFLPFLRPFLPSTVCLSSSSRQFCQEQRLSSDLIVETLVVL